MPEQIKAVISADNLKMLIAVLSILFSVGVAWTDINREVVTLTTKTDIIERRLDKTDELKELIQGQSVLIARLEEQMKNLSEKLK